MAFLHRHRRLVPYLLLAPAVAWLAVFFLAPLGFLGHQSLQTFDPIDFSTQFTWAWHNFSDTVSHFHAQLLRSLWYAAVATAAALLIAYPLVYWIAFRGGRWKNLLLLLVIAPFFVTYLIRTLAWQTILSDNGLVVRILRDIGILGSDGRLLATSFGVVAALTYNFLPFMALPLYTSLEQVDPRLVEASKDLYARPGVAFLKVTLPLSMPGVVAGSLLTFIPAAGDYVNAQLLGTPSQYMIGNVIQSLYLNQNDAPSASALSFVLMAVILLLVGAYAKLVGTERLTG